MNEPSQLQSLPTAPSPTIDQVLSALVVIALTSAFIGLFVPGLIYWEVCITFGSVLMIPPALFTGYQQYRSTFLKHPSGAKWALGVWLAVGGLALWMVQLFLYMALQENEATLLGIAAVIGADLLMVTIAVSHWRWYKKLQTAVTEGYWPAPRKWFTLKEVMLSTLALAIVSAVAAPQVKPNQGVQVAARQTPLSLPPGAKRVTYQRTSYTLQYQCDLDEAAFLAWQSSREDRKFEPVTQASLSILSEDLAKPLVLVPHVVQKGWQYHSYFEDQGTTITYDRNQQRLYYYSHTR